MPMRTSRALCSLALAAAALTGCSSEFEMCGDYPVVSDVYDSSLCT